MARSDEDLRVRLRAVKTNDLATLVDKWTNHFDALNAVDEPNCAIYWECANDLMKMIEYNEA